MRPDYWDGLSRRVRRAPPELPAEMPLGFDTRVLAERREATDGSETALGLPHLRRALVLAAVIMLLSLAGKFLARNGGAADELAYLEAAVQIAWIP